jgi:hypothetical protein
MKIKKFEELNEGISEFSDRKSFPVKDMYLLTDMDIKRINRDGRKVFYLSSELKFEESNSISHLKYKAKLNKEFPYLLFTTDEKIEKVTPLTHNIFEINELHKKKINLLFEHIIAYIQKEDEENIQESFEDNIKSGNENVESIKNIVEKIWKDGYNSGSKVTYTMNPEQFNEYWDINGDEILIKLKGI